MELKVKVNTKSNYRGLNGQWLQVKEIVGRRVSCVTDGYMAIMDFTVDEVVEWSFPANGPQK